MEEEQTKGKDVELKVTVTLPTINVSITSKTDFANLSKTIDDVVDSVSKSHKKLVKLGGVVPQETVQPIVVAQPLPAGVSIDPNNPMQAVALRSDIPLETLEKSQVFGFAGDRAQLFKSTKFATEAAVLTLGYLYSIGLKRDSIPYTEFEEAFRASNIVGKTPLYQIMINLKNKGLINKQVYDSSKIIKLEPKGFTKAEQAIKEVVLGKKAKAKKKK